MTYLSVSDNIPGGNELFPLLFLSLVYFQFASLV
jgi:hypothetical protein